jgi:hypothetical protein
MYSLPQLTTNSYIMMMIYRDLSAFAEDISISNSFCPHLPPSQLSSSSSEECPFSSYPFENLVESTTTYTYPTNSHLSTQMFSNEQYVHREATSIPLIGMPAIPRKRLKRPRSKVNYSIENLDYSEIISNDDDNNNLPLSGIDAITEAAEELLPDEERLDNGFVPMSYIHREQHRIKPSNFPVRHVDQLAYMNSTTTNKEIVIAGGVIPEVYIIIYIHELCLMLMCNEFNRCRVQ